MKRLLSAVLATALLCVLVPATAQAAINPQISFQGKLTNPDGTNVTDGNYSIWFRIYTDPTADTGACANTCKWEETQATVTVAGGLFHVNLGSVTILPGGVDFNGSALYLGIKVSADAEMTPRVRLTAAPYAFNSDTLDGIDSSALVQLSPGSQQTGNINVSGTVTSGAVNGITVGSTIQPSSAGALAIASNGANALTLTAGAASTWSTTGGLLTMQGAGGVAINTPNVSGASSAITIQGGNSSSGTAGNVTIDTGTTSSGAPAVNLANTNAKAVQIGNNTSNPTITLDSGTGAINVGTGAQARTINVGTGGATQTVAVGSANGASALDLQAGTGGIDITTQGTGALNIGNNAIAQTINIGNGTGTTSVSVLCGTGVCGFGNNAVAHATTIGSNTGTAATTLQAGSGGISLTSGGNITMGSGTGSTLLVLYNKTDSGDPAGANGGLYYNTADNDFRAYQNSRWANIQPVRYAYLSTDRTRSATSYADVTDLGFAVDANTDYEMYCVLIYQSAATGTGIGFALNGPSGPNLVAGRFISTTSSTAMNGRSFNAYNSAGKTTGVQTANANTYGTFGTFFRNGSTTGTLQLRFASETTSTVTVKAGSYCRLAEL